MDPPDTTAERCLKFPFDNHRDDSEYDGHGADNEHVDGRKDTIAMLSFEHSSVSFKVKPSHGVARSHMNRLPPCATTRLR